MASLIRSLVQTVKSNKKMLINVEERKQVNDVLSLITPENKGLLRCLESCLQKKNRAFWVFNVDTLLNFKKIKHSSVKALPKYERSLRKSNTSSLLFSKPDASLSPRPVLEIEYKYYYSNGNDSYTFYQLFDAIVDRFLKKDEGKTEFFDQLHQELIDHEFVGLTLCQSSLFPNPSDVLDVPCVYMLCDPKMSEEVSKLTAMEDWSAVANVYGTVYYIGSTSSLSRRFQCHQEVKKMLNFLERLDRSEAGCEADTNDSMGRFIDLVYFPMPLLHSIEPRSIAKIESLLINEFNPLFNRKG